MADQVEVIEGCGIVGPFTDTLGPLFWPGLCRNECGMPVLCNVLVMVFDERESPMARIDDVRWWTHLLHIQ